MQAGSPVRIPFPPASRGSFRERSSSRRSILLGFFIAIAVISSSVFSPVPESARAQSRPPISTVEQLLSGRHYGSELKDLIRAAGGEDELVDALLVLRLKPVPPQLGIRSERALLHFADRAAVFEALESDISDPQRRGLGQIIVMHLDQIRFEVARRRLARAAVERGRKDPQFRPFADTLRKSSDAAVRALASE